MWQVAGLCFLLFLAIFYWSAITGFAGTLLRAGNALIVGCVMAYILNLPMSFYERHFFPDSRHPLVRRLRRPLCLVGALLTLLVIIGGVIGLVIPELVACVKLLIQEVPEALTKLTDWFYESDFFTTPTAREVLQWLNNVDWAEKIQQLLRTVLQSVGDAAQIAVNAVSSVATVLTDVLIGLIFAVYILSTKEQLLSQFRRLFRRYLPGKAAAKLRYVLVTVNGCFRRFIVGQCTEAVILGALCIIGMWIFRFPYAMMVGTLIGFMALIPIVGAFIGAAVGMFMILTVEPIQSLWFLVFILVLQQLEGNLIYPKVVGNSIGLPGVWVLAAVTIGGGVMGIGGMLIGVPLCAAIYQLLKEDVRRGKPDKRIITDPTPPPAPEEDVTEQRREPSER